MSARQIGNDECRDVRRALGAYVLGVLDAADDYAVRAHLDRCVECGAVVAELRETGAALSLADLEMLEEPPIPSSEVLPNLLRRVSAARRRRRIVGAVAAAAAAAVVAVAGVLVFGETDPPGVVADGGQDADPAATLAGQEGTVAVEVQIWDRDWGTALTVEVAGVPAGYRCSLVAVGADGGRETAATWVVPPTGYEDSGLTMDGAHGLHSWEVDRYEVVTSDGELLATLAMNH